MRTALVNLSELHTHLPLSYRSFGYHLMGNAEAYAEVMREHGGWGPFPPLTVAELVEEVVIRGVESKDRFGGMKDTKKVWAPGTLVLIGGNTRYRAAQMVKLAQAPAVIHPADWLGCKRLAWLENTTHGVQRSADDTEMVIESILLEYNPPPSQRDIAEMAGVPRGTVQRYLEKKRAKEEEAEQRRRAEEYGHTAQPAEADTPKPKSKASTPREPEPAPAASGLIKKDAWGRPLPDRLHAVFGSSDQVRKDTRLIRGAAMSIAARKYGPDGSEVCQDACLAYVDVRGACQSIITGVEMIESTLPFIVCPTCSGRGCLECESTGTLNLTQSNELPPQTERKARNFQGVN